jgi:PAS domain S-box-containing protein
MTQNAELEERIKELESSLAAAQAEARAARRGSLSAEERANELLLDLNRARKEARVSAEQNESLIEGLRALNEALDTEQIFSGMLRVLRDILEFEDAFILIEDSGERFNAMASTNDQFAESAWESGNFFRRVLKGKTVATFDTTQIPEWQQHSAFLQHVTSALHVPISTVNTAAILICTHSTKGYFTSKHIKLAGRFAILATSALQNAELYAEVRHERDTLEQRVAERTREIESLAKFPEENPHPVLRVSEDGEIRYSNEPGRQFLGLLGLQIGNLLPEKWQRTLATAVPRNEPTREEYAYDDRVFIVTFASIPEARYVNIYIEEITDRKRAEEEVQKSQSTLSGIVESAMDGIITVDDEGRITQFNPAAESIFGRSRERVVGKHLDNLFPARYHDFHSSYMQGFGQEGTTHRRMGKTGIVRGLRANGQEFPLEGSISQVDIAGRKYFTAIVRDVTKRQRVEDELREQHQFVLALVNTMAQGLIVLDKHARLEFVNPAFANMVQSEPEDLIGKTPYELTNEEDHSALRMAWDAQKSGKAEGFEARILCSDGTEVYALAVGTPRLKDGQFTGTIGVVTDLTERRQIEEALQESEARTRLIVETALDAVVTMDMEGLITGWNNQAERIFGWHADEITGQAMSATIIPHQYRQGHNDGMSNYKRTGEGPVLNQRIEITALHRDGNEFPVELAITPVQSGGAESFSAFIRDISERKLAEQSLQEAKEIAEEAADAKAAFLASMSHEIRTPLNAVIGLTGLLLDTELNMRQAEYVETVRTSGQALLGLINNILDYSKFEAGKLELEERPFILLDFLRATVELLENEAQRKGLYLKCRISDGMPVAFVGDVTRLRQVLVNLLSNALKFTDQGGVDIQVNMIPMEKDQYHLHFMVSDSGIGIAEDRIDQLFEAFSQVDASVTRKYGGTGLGLAISRELVDMMGGRIWVESKVGSGSVFQFTVTLPMAETEQLPAEEEGLQDRVVLSGDRPLSILLAEDDAVNQMVALHMLEKLGYRADVAANGLEALDALRRQDYDVILMDHQMPEMDGVTATGKIRREWSEDKQPWIVAMTADALEGDKERFLEAGMDDYVPKPIMFNDLADALARSLPGDDASVDSPDGLAKDSAPEDVEPIDVANFEDRLGPSSSAILPNLVSLFVDEAEPVIVELRQAANDGNWARLESLGHRLSGSSSNISALQFNAACQLLRQEAKEHNQEKVGQAVAELEQEYAKIIDWKARSEAG